MSNPDYILAVDPGLATGLTFFDYRDADNPAMLWSKEASIEEMWEKVPGIIEKTPNLHVVCENFLITTETAKKTPQPYSLWLIGLLQYLCWAHQVSFTLQKPNEREFTTKEMLKSLSFWHVGGAGHANESARHAVVYMISSLKNKALVRRLIDN